MELWFVMALVASVFAGLHIFVQKVGASRGYNSSLLNSYSAGLSSIIGFVVAGLYEGYSEFSVWMLALAVLSGVVYIPSLPRMLASGHTPDTLGRYEGSSSPRKKTT